MKYIMNSYINSTDTLMHTNNLIQKREISSTNSTLNPIQSIIIRKRKNSSSIACNLSNKSIKMDHEGSMEYRIYKSQIDHLFNNIFATCKESIVLASLASKKNLEVLTPLFVETLLRETKEKELRSYLEQDPFFGEYWKDLHGENFEFSLQYLKKIRICLESFSFPIPKTIEEMLVLIKAKFVADSSV